MPRFASLGSGSRGNALVFQSGQSAVLVDCGFNLRDATARLGRLGLAPESLTAILVTHEHSDHAGGVLALARRHGLPVWMTHGTWQAILDDSGDDGQGVTVELLDMSAAVAVGDVEVRPYTVPHDAREPVQYVLSDGNRRLGVLTDAGTVTPHIEQALSDCDALVLETNHDRDMLMNGAYPAWLKQRIGGRFGHLANQEAARLLASLDAGRLQHVIAAHLSEQNNTPELARRCLEAVSGWQGRIEVADQKNGFGWRELG